MGFKISAATQLSDTTDLVSGKTVNTFTFIEFHNNTYDINELPSERNGNYAIRPQRIKTNSSDIFHCETHPEYI
jgi:hypothetical protein